MKGSGNTAHISFYDWYLYNLNFRIPTPQMPPTDRFGDVITNAVSIAIVSYAINVSMSKIFAKKHNYEIDANQVCR